MAETHEIVQGSPAWRELRLGKITASEFYKVQTQARSKADREAGKLSQTAQSYLLELAAEILTGLDDGPDPTRAMEWGTENEPAARDLYSRVTGKEVREVGFIEHPLDRMIGGSPDGLVGDDGGLEIKCPYNSRNHLAHVLGGEVPKEYISQVQGLLWITGRAWWDFVSYDPRIKDLRIALWRYRVKYDSAFCDRLDKAVFAFRDRLLETLCLLKGDRP